MSADNLAVNGFDIAGFCRQKTTQKLIESLFSDEADAGGILFGGCCQSELCGNLSDFRFNNVTDREK